MSALIYARVPNALKQALLAHAIERGLTLTGSVVELLGQGLKLGAHEQQVAGVERSLANLREQLYETEAQLRETELEVAAAGGSKQPGRSTALWQNGSSNRLPHAHTATIRSLAATCSYVAAARTPTAANH